MRLTEFLKEGRDVATQSEAKLQAVWAERDPDKKYALAKHYIETMKFKDKIPKDLYDLERIKGNNNKIDTFITNIQQKGEGRGVIR